MTNRLIAAATLGLLALSGSSLLLAGDYQAPRTVHGAPDLQGLWTNATITTLERPDHLPRLVLTATEAAEIEQTRAEFYERYDEPEKVDGTLPQASDPGGYNTFWMDEGTRLARVNGEIRSSLIVEPEDGKIPYRLLARLGMVRYFAKFMNFDGPEVRPLGERCVVGFGSTGGPPMLPVLYNNHYQIVQSAGHVMILVEMNHDARIVRLNAEHAPGHVRKWLGDSIGWWEGDTLVVETTNFHPDQSFRAATKHVLMTSEHLKVTERFTRVGEGEILYEFLMEDPTVYSRPWRGEIPLRAAPGPIYEYACHEGNYAMRGILGGARLDEKEGKAKPWWQNALALFGP